jgi:hypothetical protein
MNMLSRFGRLVATSIAVLALPAIAWPTVDDPPRSTTEWVAPEIRVNGLLARILRFESELTPQEILAFYRELWKHLTGGKGTRESTAGDWQVIAALQNNYQIVVQVRPRAPQGSDGLISMADFGAAKHDYIPAALPQFSDVSIVHVTDAVDGSKRSQVVTMVSDQSFDLNLRRWRDEWQRRGYALTSEKLAPASEATRGWIAAFDKHPHSIDMTIGRDDEHRVTHIVVNLISPAEKRAP